MIKNLKNFIIKLFILLLIILWAILFINVEKIAEIIHFNKAITICIIIFLEYTTFLILLNKFFEAPVRNLVKAIKYFLLWESEKSEKFMTETKNSDINYIVNFFKKIIFSLKWIKDEFLHGKEIKWEVWLAKEIQEKMLQKKMIEIPSLSIIMTSKPAWEVGWDSFDVIKSEDWENYYIYVWDATWHWVWAWFIMTMVNALIEWFTKNYTSWADILAKANMILKPRLKANLLMSLLLIRWNEKEKKLFMTWAWHEYLIIYKQKLNKTFRVKSGWVALWMVKDISRILKEVEIKVEAWDIIVLYSDWVSEAINRPSKDWTEELFWEDRIIKAIQEAPTIAEWYKTSISVYKSITIALSKFMWYKHTQLDDVTLGVIQIKPEDYSEEKDFNREIEPQFITEWKW